MIYAIYAQEPLWSIDAIERDQRAYEQAKQEFVGLWGEVPSTDEDRLLVLRRAQEITQEVKDAHE